MLAERHVRTEHDVTDRLLIIRPSALGDVCRTVPVLASLRRAYPASVIDWLVRDSFQDAVAAHPAINEVVPFPRRELGRSAARLNLLPSLAWMRSLRSRRYDLVIDAQGLARSGLFTWASGASRRIGYANAREGAALAYTDRVTAPRDLHTVDRMLALLDPLGVEPVMDMRLHAPEADRRAVESDARLGTHAVIAPTSAWPGKRWPGERFVGLARRLLESGIGPLVLVGAPGERDQCQALIDLARDDERVVDLVGATSVGRLMAVIEASRLVVANDSAALHMAVGFNRPIVALFGPTHIAQVGPYRRDEDVIQHVRPGEPLDHKDAEAGRDLMERISLDEVTEAALARLNRDGIQNPS